MLHIMTHITSIQVHLYFNVVLYNTLSCQQQTVATSFLNYIAISFYHKGQFSGFYTVFGSNVFTNAAPLGLGSLEFPGSTQMPPRWG